MLGSLLHFGLCHYVACWVIAVLSSGEDRGSMAARKLETNQKIPALLTAVCRHSCTAAVWRRMRLIVLNSGTALYCTSLLSLY